MFSYARFDGKEVQQDISIAKKQDVLNSIKLKAKEKLLANVVNNKIEPVAAGDKTDNVSNLRKSLTMSSNVSLTLPNSTMRPVTVPSNIAQQTQNQNNVQVKPGKKMKIFTEKVEKSQARHSETPEERRMRKAAAKEDKKQRKAMKVANEELKLIRNESEYASIKFKSLTHDDDRDIVLSDNTQDDEKMGTNISSSTDFKIVNISVSEQLHPKELSTSNVNGISSIEFADYTFQKPPPPISVSGKTPSISVPLPFPSNPPHSSRSSHPMPLRSIYLKHTVHIHQPLPTQYIQMLL